MKKTKPKSLMREVAYERFKAQLFKRNLVPGQFVSQGELCELLDVPLGPTREALKRLEAESLVRLIPQRGIQIADIGVTLIREAFEFRTVLEVAAVRRFTASASAETLDKLERDTHGMLERMASTTEPDSRMLDAALQVDWTHAQHDRRGDGQPHPDGGAPPELRQDQDDPPARPLAALPAARHGRASRGDPGDAKARSRTRRPPRSSGTCWRRAPRARPVIVTLDAAGRAARAAVVADATAKLAIAGLVLDYVHPETGVTHRAVEGLDLAVAANEFLCVLGPSGCGKSTLLAAIAGFLRPTRGSILMDGRPVTGPGADRGVVFQEYALLPWMNVLDNAALGLKLRGMSREQRHETARRYLALANLRDVEHKYPHELSGGMKQRVAVARTLANAPEVMLMDEPFAAVDAQTRMTLQEELGRIAGRSRTHRRVHHAQRRGGGLPRRPRRGDDAAGPAASGRSSTCRSRARSGRGRSSMPIQRFATLREQLLDLVRTAGPETRTPAAS